MKKQTELDKINTTVRKWTVEINRISYNIEMTSSRYTQVGTEAKLSKYIVISDRNDDPYDREAWVFSELTSYKGLDVKRKVQLFKSENDTNRSQELIYEVNTGRVVDFECEIDAEYVVVVRFLLSELGLDDILTDLEGSLKHYDWDEEQVFRVDYKRVVPTKPIPTPKKPTTKEKLEKCIETLATLVKEV